MALVLADRVRDTTTTTGTGTVTLSGTAPTGYQTFATAIGNANTTYYTINAGFQWEVGIGTFTTSGNTLTRTTVLSSSSAGSLVDFAVGTKDVFVTYPAEKSVNYDGSDNVGIGTTAPTTKLTVVGTGSATTLATGLGLVGTPAYTFTGDLNTGMWSPAADTIAFSEGGVEAMRISNAGNVGIGTTTPSYALDVSATGNISGQFKTSGSINALYLADAGTTAGTLYVGTVGNDFRVVTGSNEHVRITSAGLVGIGTSAPGAKLEVSSTSAGATVEVLRLNNPGGGANTAAQIKFFAAGTNYGTITGGYGAAAPQTTFDLPSAGNYVWRQASVDKMGLDSSGNLILTSAANSILTGATSQSISIFANPSGLMEQRGLSCMGQPQQRTQKTQFCAAIILFLLMI